MEFQVQGGTTLVVAATLAAGEQIGSEAGELGWLRGGVVEFDLAAGAAILGELLEK